MTLGRKYQPSPGFHGDTRKVYASQSKPSSVSTCTSTISLCDMIDPPDWEELAEQLLPENDPLAYPENDVHVVTIPRRIRTIKHVMPDEDIYKTKTPLFVRDCIQSYTSDLTTVEYQYRNYSASTLNREKINERLEKIHALPKIHQYEIDMDNVVEESTPQADSQPSSGRQSVTSISSSSSFNETLTPRGSWASLDLRSSSSDPLLPDIFEKKTPEQMDVVNETRRQEHKQHELLGLYSPSWEDDDAVERRLSADMPTELMGQRILVVCHQLKLELEVEPIFASMALYDAKEKRKMSENFYFNFNSECTRQMLSMHNPHADVSTLSRSAIFDITNPSQDLFLVIRLEKVLQGDVNECVEPYIRDDKNREKVRLSASVACARTGKFRMPFAWSAFALNTVHAHDALTSPGSSGSLDRKASSGSLEQVRRRGEGLTRKGSIERRNTPIVINDAPASYDSFKPIVVTIPSFFKQETDKLRDEDLYKFLSEIKRPSSAPKKLKSIPGLMKVEISPCPDIVNNALTTELAKLRPYQDDSGQRPCKEVLSFPLAPPLVPHYQYRNLLFISVKEINLNAFASKNVSARNITVRIQVMSGEDQSCCLPVIFGRSSCAEFTTEAYTTVLYHNKNPCLYDEIKVKLPADLCDQHHLLFTFLHVSCQRKQNNVDTEKKLETVLGYSWLPLLSEGRIPNGDYSLPMLLDPPPPSFSFISPLVPLPCTRWVDQHRGVFSLSLTPISTVHPMDPHIERFASACEAIEEGNIPVRIGVANMETELRASMEALPQCSSLGLARSLPVVLSRVLRLMLTSARIHRDTLNLTQHAFHAFNHCCVNILNSEECGPPDKHGRSSLLSTYIHFLCRIPQPIVTDEDIGVPVPPSALIDSSCKILHEELVQQWVLASGTTRELAMHNSWALFELIVRSMVEYLHWSGAKEAPRKVRFPEQYTDDLATLVNNVLAEIIACYSTKSKMTQSLNNSLAFFLFDLLSILDRGFVLSLVRTYYKQLSAKIASLPDAVPLVNYKLSFLRIICSHEHFVSLSLPPSLRPISPSPSLPHGSHSSLPLISLSHDFRTKHFLPGLLLNELAAVLNVQSPILQSAAVSVILSQMCSHECDSRFSSRELKARVAALYLPLLDVILDVSGSLHTNGDAGALQFENQVNKFSKYYNAGGSEEYNQSPRISLNSETSRSLLLCLCWVLKWSSRDLLLQAFTHMPEQRVYTMLQVISVCFTSIEYKGKKEVEKSHQQNMRKLEDVIRGQGSARNELILRRKGAIHHSNSGDRWRKEWSKETKAKSMGPSTMDSLAGDVAITLLQTIDTVVQACNGLEHGQNVCSGALQVILHALELNQSAIVVQHMLASLRVLILKLGWTACSLQLCTKVLVRLCGSRSARSHASATLYALMRHHYHHEHNFSRVKMQVTIALSSLVGTSTSLNEESLRRSLKTILIYAEKDQDYQDTNFTEQVKELIFNLHMILSDTVKMKEYKQDPEMLQELMYRIARGYQHSPDLRLTWLNNMAQKHMERDNHCEAGMCLLHGAALVSEVLSLNGGASLLESVSPNVIDEALPHYIEHHFTKGEMQALLEHAASELMAGSMFETVNEVYKILLPIAEANRDYKKLANIHGKLNDVFVRIEATLGKRVFGTYFRVGFYGSRFGDLDNCQFVYKEHALTKLPEFCSRLENFYGSCFGVDKVVIIKESNNVDVSTLDPDKAYIQITYVEPYFEPYELRKRLTEYERNCNIKRFIYATPFTVSGRAHGDIGEQCKRKTILTTAYHFPYVKTRIQVVNKTQIVLTPIEVAIEDIQKKTAELYAATWQEPSDAKMLQMVVQGCIGTTVNQGPFELAQVFLAPVADGSQPPTKFTNKLRLCFKDFSKKCHDALRKNKNLIGSDQREYQRELERNYQTFKDKLAPLIVAVPGHVALITNGHNKMDYKNY